jgi:glycosyltransferase involved in cell wall biosynthesis
MSSASRGGGGPAGKLKVLLACSGLGHVRRGFEAASTEIAAALSDRVSMTLARGGGAWFGERGSRRLPCLQRQGSLATTLGLDPATAYAWEQRSFAPSLYALARLGRYDIVHLHDPALLNALWHARRRLGGRFVILFTNSGPIGPEHLVRPDFVHSVTPIDATALDAAAFSPQRYSMVPYGIHPSEPAARVFADGAPRRLIGVGALNDSQKGFATAIRAVADLPGAQLRLLGQAGSETPGLAELARDLLADRAVLESVPRDRIAIELAAADTFVLPSRNEGFCMAVLEALESGTPCVVSDIPVLKWLTGDAAVQVPPDRPDLWTAALAGLNAERRRELSLRGRARASAFHWPNLVDSYLAMYEKAMGVGAKADDLRRP